MKIIADLHVHSKYSRATSKEMTVEPIAKWASLKGISLVGTGDFTHPGYIAELKSKLSPAEPGLFKLKTGPDKVRFMLTAEICNMFSQGGRGRRIHTLLFAPGFAEVEKITEALLKFGSLSYDGRPIFGFPAVDLAKMALDASTDCLVVPAHIWTPWFSIFGSASGFDSVEECYGTTAKHIFALETGLSSDPSMNWRVSMLDDYTLLSNSDAHSPAKLGREANVFDCKLDYYDITDAIRKKDRKRFLHTIEFFPEEGKYHFDGHRDCIVSLTPRETRKLKDLCPVCGKKLTIGVLNRVEQLADRREGTVPDDAIPYKSLVPLQEIIAEARSVGTASVKVQSEYAGLVTKGGGEFAVLMDLPQERLIELAGEKVAEGVMRVRRGEVSRVGGYDGVFGRIKVFEAKLPAGFEKPESELKKPDESKKQLEFF